MGHISTKFHHACVQVTNAAYFVVYFCYVIEDTVSFKSTDDESSVRPISDNIGPISDNIGTASSEEMDRERGVFCVNLCNGCVEDMGTDTVILDLTTLEGLLLYSSPICTCNPYPDHNLNPKLTLMLNAIHTWSSHAPVHNANYDDSNTLIYHYYFLTRHYLQTLFDCTELQMTQIL